MQIDIAIVAWPNHPGRWLCFQKTLASLKENLSATGHTLRYVCSSESMQDPKHQWYGEELRQLCETEGVLLNFRPGPPGLGENMNAALRLCSGDFTLLVQDDRPLLKPLDLADGIAYTQANQAVDLIRYSWPYGRSRLVLHPDGWRRIDVAGPWPYGDDPHLRRQNFTEKWGEYRENERHGTSEGDMIRRLVRGSALIVAADDIYFGHNASGCPSVVDDERYERNLRDEWREHD